MKVLVTAGNTEVPIDRVRCITNIFTGKTGASVALRFHRAGHEVRLLTSRPEAVAEVQSPDQTLDGEWSVESYRSFEDLKSLLFAEVRRHPDVIIHSAAVSDFQVAAVYSPAPGTSFDPEAAAWRSADGTPPRLADAAAGKVKSDRPEVWLRLTRTPKLIDLFRRDWGFGGVLVKFKLEVGTGEAALLEIAEQSRRQSGADLMVANTLETAGQWAYLGPVGGGYRKISRQELPDELLRAVENLPRKHTHG